MTAKTGNIDEILNQVDSESEGSIQSLFLEQEIRIKNAEIKQGSKGEYAIIQLDPVQQCRLLCLVPVLPVCLMCR